MMCSFFQRSWISAVAITGLFMAVTVSPDATSTAWSQRSLTDTALSRGLTGERGSGWEFAVVFRRLNGALKYVGVTPVEKISVGTAASGKRRTVDASATGAKDTSDYEVWLLGQGTTSGYLFRSKSGVVSAVNDGDAQSWDRVTFRQIIDRARPARGERALRAGSRVARASAVYPPPPPSLYFLCGAPVIAIARVVAVIRNAHTPVNSKEPSQHTVYAAAVEQYIKSDTRQPKPVLKIWQAGGSLPWEVSRGSGPVHRGVGYVNEQDPMLSVGERYCFFLKLPADPGGHFRRRGYVPATDGVTGKAAELDEYLAQHHVLGKVLLRDGMTAAPWVALGRSAPSAPDGFEKPPQLFGVPEAQLLANIRRSLESVDGR